MKKIPIELLGEYAVRVMDLPEGSKGFVIWDDEDFANVYVNARLSRAEQIKAAEHELDHVINDDIHSSADIRTVEARAEGRAPALKSIPRLMRAVDLLPPAPPVPNEPPEVKIVPTPYQRAVIRRALDALDRYCVDQTERMLALYDP